MKKIFLTLALVLAMSVPAFAAGSSTSTDVQDWADVMTQYPATQPATAIAGANAGGVVWSRHNLSSYGEHLQAIKSGLEVTSNGGVETILGSSSQNGFATTEVCVFCHTPHWGETTTGALWNRKATGSYTAYTSPYKDAGSGTTDAGTVTGVSGASLACLSCHDGVTQIDALINKPGGGSNTDGSNTNMNWVFREMSEAPLGKDGDTMKAGRLMIGTDLTNDHPISVVYSDDGRASLRPRTTVINSLTISQPAAFESVDTNGDTIDLTNIYGRSDNLWSVYGYLNSAATIQDVLKRDDTVQCGSCHDPHYKNQTNNDPSTLQSSFGGTFESIENDGLFLRRAGGNSNSGVCRTCHNK